MLFRQKLVLGSTSTLKKRFSNALYTIILLWSTSKCISKMKQDSSGQRWAASWQNNGIIFIFNLHTVLSYSACCLKVEMSSSSAWKLGSRAAGNIAMNRENMEKWILTNIIWKYVLSTMGVSKVYFFFIKLLINFKFSLWTQFISFG